ncbi:MAG: hypothetical protein E7312_05630 [Clostridiales bacterium]|nr:hypothetical protein [Clostridiales bacterium]
MKMYFPGFATKIFTMSFDDDCDTNGRMVELLKKYKLKATFNLNGNRFEKGERNGELGVAKFNNTEEEALEMFNNEYCEVASHGFNHECHSKDPISKAMIDIIKDRLKLEEMFGTFVRGHAVPFGKYTQATNDVLKNAGFVYNRTGYLSYNFDMPTNWFEWQATCSIVDSQSRDIARQFVAEPNPYSDGKLFYAMAHTYEFVSYFPWENVEEFCEIIAFKDDIWYATNIEIYDYVNAYRSLVFTADARKAYNPTQIDVLIGTDYGKFTVPAGKTVDFAK